MEIHVAADNSREFATIRDALASIPENCREDIYFYIHKGIYKEQISITRPHMAFMGDSAEDTVLSYGLYARMEMENGEKRGTFRTYSCLVDAHDITFRNLTIANTAGKGPDVGQALALYADGDRLLFDGCRFLGGQDTLFTGPLPPKEIEVNGFIGPKQFAPRVNGRQYYRNCYLEGDVDFIFGSAAAYFEHCEFFSKNIGQPVNGYVTAASTPQGQPYGYVMKNCRFTGNCPPRSVYLGRPWREYAKVVLLDCYIGEHILPEGWHDWDKLSAQETSFFAEYNSFGPGACMDSRPPWVHRLSDGDIEQYSRENVLRGEDEWGNDVNTITE